MRVAFLLEQIVGYERSLQVAGNAPICTLLVQLVMPSLLGGVQSPAIILKGAPQSQGTLLLYHQPNSS